MTNDRDNKKDKDLRQHEHERTERREERRDTASQREWIRATENELGKDHSPRDSTTASRDRPTDLEARLKTDLQVLKKIEGLRPDAWAKATPEGRLSTLREAEAQLAYSQGRAAQRTYMVGEQSMPMHKAQSKLELNDYEQDRLERGWLRPTEWWVGAEERDKRASQQLMWIRDEFLRGPTSADPRAALTVFLEESRHGFQRAAMDFPNKHSEVDALTLKLWQDGRRTYDRDVRRHEGGNRSAYATNPLEADGTIYAKRLVDELYRDEREDDRR